MPRLATAVPKPKRKLRAKRAHNSTLPLSKLSASQRKPVRKTNPARRKKEFARCYGSRARVAWMKEKPCVAVHHGGCVGDIQNAHTENGGRGRKGDASTIVPLCFRHHTMYDQRIRPLDAEAERWAIRLCADIIETLWQNHCGNRSQIEHLRPSSEVGR